MLYAIPNAQTYTYLLMTCVPANEGAGKRWQELHNEASYAKNVEIHWKLFVNINIKYPGSP